MGHTTNHLQDGYCACNCDECITGPYGECICDDCKCAQTGVHPDA